MANVSTNMYFVLIPVFFQVIFRILFARPPHVFLLSGVPIQSVPAQPALLFVVVRFVDLPNNGIDDLGMLMLF